MAINEKLKFSWGHIIAFVSIIFLLYISFLSITYLTKGNFIWASVGVVLIGIIVAGLFFGIQVLKAKEEKFKKWIVVERILVVLTPFVLLACMILMNHFWTVCEQRHVIEKKFSRALVQSKKLFESYESYADNRIEKYSLSLKRKNISSVLRENKIEALTIQLKSKNYYDLKESAIQWIDGAGEASVWNVFMLANIETITNAVKDWNIQLSKMSRKKMTDESNNVRSFDSELEEITKVETSLSKLSSVYSEFEIKKFQWYSLLIAFILYVMLLFPYLIQSRNTKSYYGLFRNKKENQDTQDGPFKLGESKESDTTDCSSFTL